MKDKQYTVIKFIIVVVLVLFVTSLFFSGDEKTKSKELKIENKTSQKTFNLNKYTINKSGSLWVIVNKQRPLDPREYQPSNLVVPNVPLRLKVDNPEMKLDARAAKDLEELYFNAKNIGIELILASAYRSYELQANVYDSNVRDKGQAVADKTTARPGYSEHQTGLALDFTQPSEECFLAECFGQTKEGKWLAKNAYKFGFVLRYPLGQENITGITYEPWHFRYVGKELAQLAHQENKPLETIFNLSPATNY